jgi:hypothetical protein
MRCILIICCFLYLTGHGQWKDYKIGVKGDTLNRIDKQDKKQGPWVIRIESVRGEPGYEEEGAFKNNKKEGPWRKYSLQGDLFAIENYRWGFKDGSSKYFDLGGNLVKEEGWMALDPEKEYDTIDVENVDVPNTFTRVVIKNEGASLKHGNWKYYDATGFITKTEFWHIGKRDDASSSDNTTDKKKKDKKEDDGTVKKKVKPKEVLDFEKKNSGKKKIKVRDGTVY